jgi:MFS family permease
MPVSGRLSVWRQRDYVKLWSAATVSVMGSQITLLAVPFIALTMLGASAFEVSLLAAVEMLPFLLFTLPAGAWLDRIRRRPVLIAADLGRGVTLLLIPLAYVAGALALWQLFLVAFVTGTLTAFFDVADQSYLPVILGREDLVAGNAGLQVSYSAAQIGGPTLGGHLIALMAAPLAIVGDALTFFASGAFLAAIRRGEPKPDPPIAPDGQQASLRADIGTGLRYVLSHRYLRPIAGCTATSNLFGAAMFAVWPVLIWNELQLPPAFYGSMMGLASIGFLVGAALAGPLSRRSGFGPTIVLSAAASCPAFLLMAFTPRELAWAAVTLFAGWSVAGFSQVVYNVTQISLRQGITPLEMQSRMNATMRFIVWGTIPIGSVLGGLLATALPIRTAVAAAAAGSFLAVGWVLFSPVRSLGQMPPIEAEPGEPQARPAEASTA